MSVVLKSKKLGSYPYANVVVSTTISLLAIGILVMIILIMKQVSASLKENIEIQIMLDNGLGGPETEKLKSTIASQPFVRKVNNLSDVRYIPKEEAAKELVKSIEEDFIELLGENPLRNSFIIRIQSDYYSLQQLELIQQQLQQIPGVFEVVYAKDLPEQVNSNVATVSFVLLGFALFMMITVIILIHNTIRLALFSQRFIIRSMQLVGATDSFIRKPFLRTAFLQGLLSGALASAALYFILPTIHVGLLQVQNLYNPLHLWIVCASIIGAGVLLTVLSSLRAVNKYLGMSLDELY